MIGNDIVDLSLARIQSNWQRKGFLQKLFTPDEQQAILNHPEPGLMVWILWTMKEAAYKIYNRQTLDKGFFPHLLECEISTNTTILSGKVCCKGREYLTSTVIDGDFIHTLAVTQPKDLQHIYEISSEKVEKDSYGFPFVYKKGIRIPVSKSHHGRFEKVVQLSVY